MNWTPQANYTRPSDCRLSVKLVPTFADTECRVVSTTDPHGRSSRFLDYRIRNINITVRADGLRDKFNDTAVGGPRFDIRFSYMKRWLEILLKSSNTNPLITSAS
jgi:hypothetical protein